MITTIKEDLLKYLADDYLNTDWQKVKGAGNFNKDLPDEYKINNFSLGNFRKLEKNFLLVQVRNIQGSKDTLGQIGTIDFGTTITLNIYIDYTVKPTNCSLISDLFIDTLYNRLQQFIYDYRNNITPTNPSIIIDKYYSNSTGNVSNFNNIENLIIDCSLTFDYKRQDLTLERIGE